MAKVRILVRRPRGVWPRDELPAFVLEQDNWDDYGFKTSYSLSFAELDKSGKVIEDLIGAVKILRAGQKRFEGPLITSFDTQLDPDFCSVGTSLDYYQRLRALPASIRDHLLIALRDVVAKPKLKEIFSNEEGWSRSLFRDGKDDGYLKLATGLLTGDYSHLPKHDLKLEFQMPGWLEPTIIDFQSSKNLSVKRMGGLPDRVAVLVGRNGCGKSTVLSRLARIALGTIDERDQSPLRELGRLSPAGIGFPRVITVTFSPLDSFRLPGADGRSRRKILAELKAGDGRFSFIGLRDIAAEGTRATTVTEEDTEISLQDLDRLPATKLKSIEQLATEFTGFLKVIKNRKKSEELDETLESLLADSAFAPLLPHGICSSRQDKVIRAFLGCSTGHKIVALTIAGLIAKLEPWSLVLFDEPESHLHPPLLAAFMHALRKIINDNDSYCVLATHSPVIVQESMAKHVKVVKREGAFTLVVAPKAETFGESIGLITTEVFGLNSEITDYHRVLDRLIKSNPKQDALEELFLNGQMSNQARAYVMSRRIQAKKAAEWDPLESTCRHASLSIL